MSGVITIVKGSGALIEMRSYTFSFADLLGEKDHLKPRDAASQHRSLLTVRISSTWMRDQSNSRVVLFLHDAIGFGLFIL